jgi:hypothetical protein
MFRIILTIIIGTIVSPSAFAQGKLYLIPHVGFYSGAYKSVDTVNSKQGIIYTKPFLGKDFSIGLALAYTHNKFEYSLGVESGFFSSGFKHTEPKLWPNRVDSKESLSQGEVWVYKADAKYDFLGLNLKKPKKYLNKTTEKKYLVVSRFYPFIGAEIRRLGRTFVQDFVEYNSSIGTSTYGTIPGSNYYHSYKRHHFSIRAGFDWVFYDGEKRRFILTFMYQFAFKDAGYFRYHFSKPTQGIDFYYQTTTRGNGLSIKAGFPIKLFEINKKKAVH